MAKKNKALEAYYKGKAARANTKSHYGQVSKKTETAGKQGKKNKKKSREETKEVVKGIGSSIKSNTVKTKPSESKPQVTGESKQVGGSRRTTSGAVKPVNSKGTDRRQATSTARTTAKQVGKSVKTAVNPHKGDTVQNLWNMKQKEGESDSDFLKRKVKASQKYNANGTVRQEYKVDTGYTDKDREKISAQTEKELNKFYGKKYNRVKAFRDMWDEKGGLGEQFKEIYGREATAEEKKDYYKKYWKADYQEQTAKMAKEQADAYAKETAPEKLYAKEMSANEAAAAREYSKYIGKGKLGNKALKNLGTLKYTLDDIGSTKPDGTKVTKKDLGKVKLDKKGKPKFQQVEMRDYQGNVVKDKNGNPVVTDRNLAEELGSLTAAGTSKAKFATGFMQGASPIDIFNSGVGEYNNAAKKVIQNTKESNAYMGGYMAGFGAQFMASGVPFVERGLMEQAMTRGVVENAEGVVGKLLNKAIGGAQKNAGIKFAENRGLELALEAPLNLADAAKMSMDENGNVNTKALAFYMALNSGMTAGMGGAMEGVGVAFTRSNSKRFADLYAKSLAGTATEADLKEMNSLQLKLDKAGQDIAVAKSNVSHKALYNKTVADVVFNETRSADDAIKAMNGATEHVEKMQYAQAIRDKALSDIDDLRADRIKLLDEATHAEPEKAIELRRQASALQAEMDSLSNIARGADSQFKVSAKANRRAVNELKVDLQRMSYNTGVNYRCVDSDTMHDIMLELGDTPKEGTFYQGFFYKNEEGKLEVLINTDSPQAHQIIVGHEMTHLIKDSVPAEEFKALGDLVRDFSDGMGELKELEQEIRRSYPSATEAQIQEELTCELVGKYIVGADKDFIKKMAGDNPSLLRRIVNYIKELFDTTTSKELKSQYKKLYDMVSDAAGKIDADLVRAPEMGKGGEIRASQFKTEDITPEKVAPNGKVTEEADAAYMEAAKSGDTERAQAFVDAALEARGYKVEAYHGTPDFGFTEFDRGIMESKDSNNSRYGAMMVFASSDPKVSKTYLRDANAGVSELKDAKRRIKNEYKLTDESIQQQIYAVGDDIYDMQALSYRFDDIERGETTTRTFEFGDAPNGDTKFTLSYSINDKAFEMRVVDNEDGRLIHKFVDKPNGDEDLKRWIKDVSDLAEDEIRYMWQTNKLGTMARSNAGIYRAKLKMDKPFVLDAKGVWWNELPIEKAVDVLPDADAKLVKDAMRLRKEIDASGKNPDAFFKDNPDKMDEWRDMRIAASDLEGKNSHITFNGLGKIVYDNDFEFKTRELADMVYDKGGYDSVEIDNVKDLGGEQIVDGAGKSNVYILFNSEQFKVADAITYDDNKNIIPLSKRGDETNPDIRYSQKEASNGQKERNIRLRKTEGEVQKGQVLNESDRKVGKEEGRGLEGGRGNSEAVRVVSDDVRKKMDSAGIGNAGLREADYDAFSKALDDAKKANPRGDYVDGKSIEELKEKGAKCYLSEDGRAGVCVEKDGNISGLFRHPDSSHKGVLRELILTARENGGKKMDCFGDYLADAYEQCGFKIVNKIENNPKFSSIKDDVYTLMVTNESTSDVLYRMRTGNFKESTADVPYFSIAEYGDDAYDKALEARDKRLDWESKYMMSEEQIRALDDEYEKALLDIDAGFSLDSIAAQEKVDDIVERVASSRMPDTVARNEDGSLIHMFHSTMANWFNKFEKSFANPTGDSGAGFYSSSRSSDAHGVYADPSSGDNQAKISDRAMQILYEAEDEGREMDWGEAFEQAEDELIQGGTDYEFFVDVRNPVYVGNAEGRPETNLMDTLYEKLGGTEDEYESPYYNREDFDTEEEYRDAVDDEWYENYFEEVDRIAYEVEDLCENYEDCREAIREMFSESLYNGESLTYDRMKDFMSQYALYDERGRNMAAEVPRAICEYLGHDCIWDNNVAHKTWSQSLGMREGDFHIIAFRPEQYKLADARTFDDAGNVIPPSERFNQYEQEFRYSQKEAKRPKLDTLKGEVANYEAALKKAKTKEEKEMIQEALDNAKGRLEKFEKSDAPKEAPKKLSKDDVKARVEQAKESQEIRKEFNKYRDKSKKWSTYKEISDLEQERWKLMDEMGYKRGNKKQEARLEEIHDRLTELGRYDDDYEAKKAETLNGLWNSFRNKRNKAANKADLAEIKGAQEEVKSLQPKLDALNNDIKKIEAKLRKARSEDNIKKYQNQLRGKKAARTRIERQMAGSVDAMSNAAEKSAKRLVNAPKKGKPKPKAETKPAEPPTGKQPVDELVNPKISKTDKSLKEKALKDGDNDVNLTVRREREYIKEQYGDESNFFKVINDAINSGMYNKKKGLSIKEAQEKAASELKKMGYEELKNLYLRTNPLTDEFLATARIEVLRKEINRLAEAGGDTAKLAADERLLWQPMAEMSNMSGRGLRAIREIRMLTEEGRRQVVYGEIERLQKKYAKRIKGGQIEVDPKKIERLTELEDGKERDELLQEINIDIWSQIPASFWEKMNEIRHCFMLFNARTHGRNIFGNLVFAGIRKTSDEFEYAILNSKGVKQKIESMGGSVDKARVTRAEKREFDELTKNEFHAIYDTSESRNKFIELGRPPEVPTINWKPMQDVINNNYWLLEQEDLKLTLIPAFQNAYLGWCKSHCPEETTLKEFMENMSNAKKNKARHYALVQGEYATFRDNCALSSWLTAKKQYLAGMKGETWYGTAGYRALDTVLEGALPFVKTPVNVFRRSVDYSPISLIRAWSELHKATDVEVFKKGIHDLCTGLTGTGIMGIGFYLATQDWVTLKTGSDRMGSGDEYIDRDMGFQDYSLKITPPNLFGKLNKDHKTWSWSLDWASPTAMSLFAGAALYEQIRHGIDKYKDDGLSAFFNGQQAMNAFFAITSPMTDTSFMSSSKDTMQKFLERATRGSEGSDTDFAGAMAQLITGDLPKNYVTGFEPQIMAQIAGFLDPVQRDTRSTAKSEFVRGWDSAFKQLVSRVPVARTMLNPKLDRYGADKINEDSTFARFLEAMVMPSNVKQINMNERDQELIKIRNNIEDKTSDDYKYFWYAMSGNPTLDLANGKRMTYDELYKYGKRSRRFQTKMFDDMLNSSSYKNMTWKMRADEVDECSFISQNYADWKVYGANYATQALVTRAEHEGDKLNAYRSLKGVGKKNEAANETYMKYYIRKERYINRSHADANDGYYLKALSALMTGDQDLVNSLDLADSKVTAMSKYMEVSLRRAKGDKKVRREKMFTELTDNCCNIMSNIAGEGLDSATKGIKSVSAGLCAMNGDKVPERVYRAFGHNWNSAQAGAGLQKEYNKDGKYDLKNINKYKTQLKAMGDINGDGKKGNKKDVMQYIEKTLKVTDPDEAACLYEVLYSQGRYKNPYKSQINDHLEWGKNRDKWWETDVGGSGGRGRRGWGHGHRGGGGGGGGGSKGKMPTTASGAISGKVTDPFATSNGSKSSTLNDAYRKKVRKLRKELS